MSASQFLSRTVFRSQTFLSAVLASCAERDSIDTKPHIRRGTVREISDSAVQEVEGNYLNS